MQVIGNSNTCGSNSWLVTHGDITYLMTPYRSSRLVIFLSGHEKRGCGSKSVMVFCIEDFPLTFFFFLAKHQIVFIASRHLGWPFRAKRLTACQAVYWFCRECFLQKPSSAAWKNSADRPMSSYRRAVCSPSSFPHGALGFSWAT